MKKNNKQHIFSNFLNVFIAGILSSTMLAAQTEINSSVDNYQTPGIAIAKISMPEIKSTHGLLLTDVQTTITAKALEILKNLQQKQQETTSLIARLKTLFETTISEATQYHLLVSHIETRLQIGTTPANPDLRRQENQSALHLKQISASILSMNEIEALIAQAIQITSSLHQETQKTFTIPGALEEDHANLVALSSDITHLMTTLKNLSEVVSINKQRQTQWLSYEQDKFSTLSQAILAGRFALATHSVKALPFPETVGFEKTEITQPISGPVISNIVTTPVVLVNNPTEVQEAGLVVEPIELIESSAPVSIPKAEIPHISLSDVEKGRKPIAILSLKDENIKSFKWYAYSAASRHLNKNTHEIIDIVTIAPIDQSHEIIEKSKALRDLMVEMGLEAKNFRLIHTTDNQLADTHIHLYK